MRNQIKEIERLKRMGNEAFSAGNFAEAETQYSEALQTEGLPVDVQLTLLTNRATARHPNPNPNPNRPTLTLTLTLTRHHEVDDPRQRPGHPLPAGTRLSTTEPSPSP